MLARISVLVLPAVLLLVLHPKQADACSCLPWGPPAEAYGESDAVFVGRVISVVPEVPADPYDSRLAVTLEVERVFKGVTGRRVTVFTASNEAACGYPFVPGTAHLVYADRYEANRLDVSLCSRTMRLEHAAEDIEALERLVDGAPAAPTPPEGPAPVPPRQAGCAGCASTTSSSGAVGIALWLGLLLSRMRQSKRRG